MKNSSGKKKGCLIALLTVFVVVVAVGITLGVLLSNHEKDPPQASSSPTADINVLGEVKNATDAQKEKILSTLGECGITDVAAVKYDDGLEGLFTYTDANGYGTEDGYRVSTKSVNNIILYVQNGEVLGIRYADTNLYENGSCVNKLADITLTADERTAIITQAQSWVKDTLQAPSTAKFPSLLTQNDDWAVWKQDEAVFVKSYVDAENAYGANIRSQFQLKVVDNKVVSYILDGKEMVNK